MTDRAEKNHLPNPTRKVRAAGGNSRVWFRQQARATARTAVPVFLRVTGDARTLPFLQSFPVFARSLHTFGTPGASDKLLRLLQLQVGDKPVIPSKWH